LLGESETMDMTVDSVWHISNLELTIRMITAVVLGGAIGLEREYSNHAAGFRTHILVCIGSTVIMLLSIYGFGEFADEFNVRMDPARLAAQVISGIGFLGAGAILRNGSSITGLTTAASIWVVAAIGLAVGAGFYYPAALTTVLVLVILFLLNKWEKHLLRHRRNHEVTIKILDKPGTLGKIATKFGEQGVTIRNLTMSTIESDTIVDDDEGTMEIRFQLKAPNPTKMLKAIEEIMRVPEVLKIDSTSLPLTKGSLNE
jgi:putative Mg2+ transporter-C (MgtC) family protein